MNTSLQKCRLHWKSLVYEGIKISFFRRGYQLIPLKNNLGINIFWDLRTLFQGRKIVVVDVGANNGEYATELSKWINISEYIAIEPIVSLIPDLTKSLTIFEKSKIHNLILGDTKKNKVAFRIAKSSVMSSTKKPGKDSWHTIEKIIKINQVTGTTLLQGISIDFLKIDTQGTELQVLKGFESKLANGEVKFVLCEQIFTELYLNQDRFHELLTFMDRCGYDLLGLYNCVYKKFRLSFADVLFQLKE